MERILVSLVFACLPGTAPLYAGVPDEAREQGFSIGTEVYRFTYEEPSVMQESGAMVGLTGSYSFFRENCLLRAEARAASGEVDYTSIGTGSISGIDDYAFELRALAGYDIIDRAFGAGIKDSSCIAYTGLGYRYLEDDSGGRASTTGHYGYRRESNYFYSPAPGCVL
ncbi:MAG: hypothetical protein PHT59_03905 [Candidatus Omnitrophica bacterium]|nr:hypothetical protein [Candidatus Omnitrophota bacterium]